ncbi:MAG: hypothetical protein J7L90_04145 [Dehalococcoidia bacterium]|nr:hypothetical protein [Dehalococcoidia bacterium]
MTDRNHKQKIITPIGANFVEFIVPHLMAEAFTAYKKRNFTKTYFQVNPCENSHSAAAIVLVAVAIEAYRNRIYYMGGESVPKGTKGSVPSTIGKMFLRKLSGFPDQKFETIVQEVFVVRDVIVHSHIHELNVVFNSRNWDMVKGRKLNEYGDGKFKKSVDTKIGKTNLIGFNVQPLKIGFEDLFKTLLVLDLFAGIAEKALGRGCVSFALLQKFDNHWTKNLSQLLTHYYDQAPNQKFAEWVESFSKGLREDFGSFLPDGDDCFITNTCPKCSALGFHKLEEVWRCNACGVKLGFKLNGIITSKPLNQDHE